MSRFSRVGRALVCLLPALGLSAVPAVADKVNYAWCKDDNPRRAAHCQGQGPPNHLNVPTPHQMDIFGSLNDDAWAWGMGWNWLCNPNNPFPGPFTCCHREDYNTVNRWYYWRNNCTVSFPANPQQVTTPKVWETCDNMGLAAFLAQNPGLPPPPPDP